jgi:hypothetical protein
LEWQMRKVREGKIFTWTQAYFLRYTCLAEVLVSFYVHKIFIA